MVDFYFIILCSCAHFRFVADEFCVYNKDKHVNHAFKVLSVQKLSKDLFCYISASFFKGNCVFPKHAYVNNFVSKFSVLVVFFIPKNAYLLT